MKIYQSKLLRNPDSLHLLGKNFQIFLRPFPNSYIFLVVGVHTDDYKENNSFEPSIFFLLFSLAVNNSVSATLWISFETMVNCHFIPGTIAGVTFSKS